MQIAAMSAPPNGKNAVKFSWRMSSNAHEEFRSAKAKEHIERFGLRTIENDDYWRRADAG
jgi:hypothetical protein